MKKLIMIAAALAITFTFLPNAQAGDAAELGLNVTFAVDQPPRWEIEPQDAKVVAGQKLIMEVKAVDPDGDVVYHMCKWYLNGEAQPLKVFPEGAAFHPKGAYPEFVPYLEWDVPVNINLSDVHEFLFVATTGTEDPAEDQPMISKKIKVTILPPPVISIELTPTTWVLGEVKLGERRNNRGYNGVVIHSIKNTGNVSVNIDIGYGPQIDEYPAVHPGLAQGKDTFVTIVDAGDMGIIIPPDGKVNVGGLPPDNNASLSLPLTYGAPTALSQGIKDHGVTYEIRAYAATN